MAVPERSAALSAEPAEVSRVLDGLRPGATMCPGELARRLGTTQATLRSVLADMAAQGRVVITQRGEAADLATLRGPYRVAPPRRG